jgi:hypothetical protein
MISVRTLVMSFFGALLLLPMIYAQDLSRYREFQIGAGLPAIAKQVQMDPSAATATHQRPAVIQELEWRAHSYLESPPRADSVKKVLFSFYNGELFRLVVTYDPERTEGMTAEDMIEAVSAKYGTAARPVAEIILPSTMVYSDGEKSILVESEKVIARWEDSEYSFNLFQSSTRNAFGLVGYSKRLDALARAAIAEATRLDEQEAPQREIGRQQQKDEQDRAQQEKARQANKAPFRP